MHQVFAVVVDQLEEVQDERYLARLLFNPVDAAEAHEHGLKRLLLFE